MDSLFEFDSINGNVAFLGYLLCTDDHFFCFLAVLFQSLFSALLFYCFYMSSQFSAFNYVHQLTVLYFVHDIM